MFLASFLIGLREGLEASLIIGILLAYVTRIDRSDVKQKIWWGVSIAIALSLTLGAFFTFGRYALTFVAQEVIGGTMSLIAVGMVTWMVFWMMRTASGLKHELQQGVDQALAIGTGWAIFWLAFATVAREGIETTLMLWGWAGNPIALLGAVTGILIAAGIGIALNRGMLRINLRVFFAWTGGFLIIVAAGILAYGIHDLQEAAWLPGPFSGHPITPTDLRTGEVLTGFDGPFWLAAFPFGWAFNVEDTIPPASALAAFLKGTVGFVPQMTWLEVTAWACYMGIAMPRFLAEVRKQSTAAKLSRHAAAPSAQAAPNAPGAPAAPGLSTAAATPATPAAPATHTAPQSSIKEKNE